jgi:hypothetical protein
LLKIADRTRTATITAIIPTTMIKIPHHGRDRGKPASRLEQLEEKSTVKDWGEDCCSVPTQDDVQLAVFDPSLHLTVTESKRPVRHEA